jgi:hypothetical protein
VQQVAVRTRYLSVRREVAVVQILQADSTAISLVSLVAASNTKNEFCGGALLIFDQLTLNMAFEQPLEADRVDLNFVSIIARAPVIGSLMFFFGGDLIREDTERILLAQDSSIDGSLVPSISSSDMFSVTKAPRKSSLKKAPPSLAGSEISDMIGECREGLEGMHLMITDNNNNDNDSIMSPLSRKKKSLSWSDQSGQNLVKYMDEEVSERIMCDFISILIWSGQEEAQWIVFCFSVCGWVYGS